MLFSSLWVQVASFNEWIGSQAHPIKLVIAGNHELGFDSPKKKEALIAALGGCQYVEDAIVQLPGAPCLPMPALCLPSACLYPGALYLPLPRCMHWHSVFLWLLLLCCHSSSV